MYSWVVKTVIYIFCFKNNYLNKISCPFNFQRLRMGVFDVIPSNSLDGLTSEDLRLLLNGVGTINVATLISYTSFNDESSKYLMLPWQYFTVTMATKLSHLKDISHRMCTQILI